MIVHDKKFPPFWTKRIAVRVVAVALMFACEVGCGSRPTILTGTVTLDGQPLSGAMLKFFPLGPEGRTAAVQTDASGHYRLEISPHPLRVAISKFQVVGQVKDGDSTAAVSEEIIPLRYSDVNSSELSVAPVSGSTTSADFVLTTGKG